VLAMMGKHWLVYEESLGVFDSYKGGCIMVMGVGFEDICWCFDSGDGVRGYLLPVKPHSAALSKNVKASRVEWAFRVRVPSWDLLGDSTRPFAGSRSRCGTVMPVDNEVVS
jgi:hypothetical protein